MYKISFTYFLIALSVIITLLSMTFFPWIVSFGMNNFYLSEWHYLVYSLQLFLYSFIHWGLLHLFMNCIFLYYFGSVLELLIWRNKYIIFFAFVTLFNATFLTIFQGSMNTIWISGFCMALLSYYVLELKSRNNPEYKWWITAIVLNILIWFIPWISMFWHLFWAIAGVIFYYINKDWFRPKLVWKVAEETL